jgi:hypothetical protein
VSFLGKKHPDAEVGGLGGQAMQMAKQAVPVAKQAVPVAKSAGSAAAQQAVPLARSAGTSVKHGADGAIAWAAPYVGAARHWAAPRLEQSAATLTDSVAPRVSEALRTAAHKIDYVPAKPNRLKKAAVLAGTMALTAAGAAAAITLRHRQNNGTVKTAEPTVSDPTVASLGTIHDGQDPGEQGMPDPDANGHPTAG